jgi:flotillin
MVIGVLSRLLCICRPNEILVISGRKRRADDGTQVGYRVVNGGWAFRLPIIEKVQRMDIRSIPIDVSIQGAYTRVGIPLRVRAIAIVKISAHPRVIMNAVERFLGRNVEDIQQVAKETLEGNLRGVLATLTPEEVNEDRLKFSESLSQEVEQDLSKLGLHLDVLKIQHVTDDANYLASIGRGQIAQVIKDAEIAESNARNEAAKEAAAAEMRSKVAQAEAERLIAQQRNEVRRVSAELEAEARSIEERSEAAAQGAYALAMQGLEGMRREVETLRLQCDVVVPAEIRQEASVLEAVGTAASTAENGRATAASLSMVADAWTTAGSSAQEMFLINKIEDIAHIVVEAVQKIKLGPVHLVDNGDGQTLPRFAAAYPNAVAEVLRSLATTTGVDITALLAGAQGSSTEKGARS